MVLSKNQKSPENIKPASKMTEMDYFARRVAVRIFTVDCHAPNNFWKPGGPSGSSTPPAVRLLPERYGAPPGRPRAAIEQNRNDANADRDKPVYASSRVIFNADRFARRDDRSSP